MVSWDMSSSMFWKIFSYYLPFFYSNIFGLSWLMQDCWCWWHVFGMQCPIRWWESLQTVLIRVGVNTVLICCGTASFCHCRDFTFYNARHGDNSVSWYGLMSLTSWWWRYIRQSMYHTGYVGSNDWWFGTQKRFFFLPYVFCIRR